MTSHLAPELYCPKKFAERHPALFSQAKAVPKQQEEEALVLLSSDDEEEEQEEEQRDEVTSSGLMSLS